MKKKNFVGICGDAFFKFHFFENLFSAEGNIWEWFVDDETEREESMNDYWCTSEFSLPKMCGFTFYSFFSPRFHHQYSHRKKYNF
jgi:hypothetical protein